MCRSLAGLSRVRFQSSSPWARSGRPATGACPAHARPSRVSARPRRRQRACWACCTQSASVPAPVPGGRSCAARPRMSSTSACTLPHTPARRPGWRHRAGSTAGASSPAQPRSARRFRRRTVPRQTGCRCQRRVRAACAGTRRRWCARPRRPCLRRPAPGARRPGCAPRRRVGGQQLGQEGIVRGTAASPRKHCAASIRRARMRSDSSRVAARVKVITRISAGRSGRRRPGAPWPSTRRR